MLIKQPAKISHRIDFLGTDKTCLYLLKGRDAMIIGGGMSWTAPALERQFSTIDYDPARIKYLVIPHSHFDHCGAVPYLKRKFPHLEIVASAYCQQLFAKERVIKIIAAANDSTLEKMGMQGEYDRLNLEFDGIHVDRAVAEGDIIDLGEGMEVQFIETPGHTRCSISSYVPALKAMFPSDSAPFPTEDGTELSYPSAQYSFSLYMESLRKLASYEVEICGFDHHGVFTLPQARTILRQGLEHSERFRKHILSRYRRTGDPGRLAGEVAAVAVEKNRFPFLQLELETTVARMAIDNIIKDENSHQPD